jgi:hypothetical protein
MNTPAERIDFFTLEISDVEKVRNSEDNVPHVLIPCFKFGPTLLSILGQVIPVDSKALTVD